MDNSFCDLVSEDETSSEESEEEAEDEVENEGELDVEEELPVKKKKSFVAGKKSIFDQI